MRYLLQIDYDDSPENPCSWGVWKVYSFSRGHIDFKDPHTFDETFVEKLKNKTAFVLSYSEHGACQWTLANVESSNESFDFDTVKIAGIIEYIDSDNDVDLSLLENFARDFLKTYTKWCNGEVYGYTLYQLNRCDACHNDEKGDVVSSVCGFYSAEELMNDVHQYTKGVPPEELTVSGNAAFILQ